MRILDIRAQEVRGRLLDNMHAWGRAGAELRGLANDEWAVAENTFLTPIAINRYIESLVDTLDTMRTSGAPPPPPSSRRTPAGQEVVQLLPATDRDRKDSLRKDVTAEL